MRPKAQRSLLHQEQFESHVSLSVVKVDLMLSSYGSGGLNTGRGSDMQRVEVVSIELTFAALAPRQSSCRRTERRESEVNIKIIISIHLHDPRFIFDCSFSYC